eukprot:768818-Hanusia_phi.AAC.14
MGWGGVGWSIFKGQATAVTQTRDGKASPSMACDMICKLFDLEDYAGTYRETRNAYLKAANQLKLATGPYKAARDAYVAATATYTKSLYE